MSILNRQSEADTRYNLIDPLLTKVGWNLADRRSVSFSVAVDGNHCKPIKGSIGRSAFIQKGKLEATDLDESPFTNFGMNAVEKLFSDDVVEEILDWTKD